nr:hypothetical protein [Pedobacter sp. ASV19]
MSINWNRLQPYKTTKTKSFEQLCYQIAFRMHGEDGVFTPIDDSGGGDGVEFYLTFPDGREWGWQAKYYEGSPRLSVSGRKAAIVSSLQRATSLHPLMEVWYLCLPMDLTPDEDTWVKSELSKHIPSGHPAKIVVWNESFIHERLNQPMFNGLKQAFFNALELSPQWFSLAFKKAYTLVENKFDSFLYTANEEFEYNYVNPLLCNEKFNTQRIAYYPRKLSELLDEGKKKLKKLNYTNDIYRSLFNKYLERYGEFNGIADGLLPKFKERLDNLTPNSVDKLADQDFSAELEAFRAIVSELDDFRRNWYQQHIDQTDKEKERQNIDQFSKVSDVDRIYSEFIEELKYYVSHSRLPLKWRLAHFLGNGGDGKTNFAVALAKEYLDADLPAIFLPAILLTSSNPLADQFLALLDIKAEYSFAEFLDCLDELGRINNRRIPFILDGLNEAIDSRGALNERLSLDLPQLELDFLERRNLVLITTCRTSYQQGIWGTNAYDDPRFHFLYGFTNHEDKKKLVKTYFRHYKIQADLSFLSLERFTKPLYLKLFCESVNSVRSELKQVTLGFDSIYQIFEDFVALCDANVFRRIQKAGKLPPTAANKKLASRVLDKLGQQLWEQHQRAIPLEDLMVMADGKMVDDYQHSVTKALLDEELLFVRNWNDGEEHVHLTYDLLAGYFIAKHLLEVTDDFAVFFASDQAKLLVGDDYQHLHPNHEDILEGICSLLPIKKQVFLHDLFSTNRKKMSSVESHVFSKSIQATLLLSPAYIPAAQVDFLRELAENPNNFVRMFAFAEGVLFVSNHPFNFNFWASQLSKMAMNQRDSLWSEYLRGSLRESFMEELVMEFEELLSFPEHTKEQLEKIVLVAEFLKWSLTTTNRSLKEKSGGALFAMGISLPKLFFEQFYSAAAIGDPAVFEWMCGALYTATIYLVKGRLEGIRGDLRELAEFLRDQILSPNGRFATNHLGIRNYCVQTLRTLVKKVPEIGDSIDLDQVLQGLENLGIVVWQESEDPNEDEYRDGNSLIDYYFNKEKMPRIYRGLGSDFNKTPEYLAIQAKLRWRAYQLGYEFERFGELDKKIANSKHWGGEFSETDRYADKYIDIAFQEYCGFLDSRDSFENYQDMGYLRTFKPNYDPMAIDELDEDYMPQERFEVRNFIDTQVSLEAWGTDTAVPDLSDFLQRDDFQGKAGDWILMDSLVHQHDKSAQRQFYFKIDTVFVKNVELSKARMAFCDETELGRAANAIPYTEHVLASEVPDGESIPHNEWKQWRYSLSERPVENEYTRLALIQNGERLSEDESDLLWKSVVDNVRVIFLPRTASSAYHEHLVKFRKENGDQQETIEEALERMGIEVLEEKFTKQEIEPVEDEIEVFVPVRYHMGKVYLCKDLIDELELSSPQHSTDLLDSDGLLACFNYSYEVEYVDQETFTYLRRDLLKQYLVDNELTMFQIIWGERDYYPEDGDWDKVMRRRKDTFRSSFYQAIEYSSKVDKEN